MPVKEPQFVSVFANVVNDTHSVKLELQHYLDQYEVIKADKISRVNFVSVASHYRKRFSVPDDAIPHLMVLLSNCYKCGVSNGILEVQDTNEAGASGLVFEFCIVSEQQRIEFGKVSSQFINILFNDILTQWIGFSSADEKHYCIYQVLDNPVYDCKTAKFKSVFRITIPSILLTPDVRYFVYERVWKSREVKKQFEQLNLRVRDCFMRSLRTSPMPLMGSSSEANIEPLSIDTVYRIDVSNGVVSGLPFAESGFEENIDNIVHSCSINFPAEGSMIEKGVYSPSSSCIEAMRKTDNAYRFQMAYDDAMAEFIDLSISDRSLETIRDIVYILSKDRFLNEESYREVIRCLAVESRKYHCVAVMATKDKRSKDLPEWDDFEELWAEARAIPGSTMYSTNTIRYWASLDDPSRLERYVDEAVKSFVVRDIRDPFIHGRIGHNHIAKCLEFMFQNNFISFRVSKGDDNWMEFVTPESSEIEPGQLYKWRNVGKYPGCLSIYISERFAQLAQSVHSDLRTLQYKLLSGDKAKDQSTENIKKMFRAYDQAIINIFNHDFKFKVIKEASSLFKRDHFVKRMDSTEHIIGVGNGVLELTPHPKLLNHYHMHPISLFTDTCYVPYDENSEYVKTVYKMLWSLVPDDETDALEFLLYYFSTSLDRMPKEALFLIIHGGGSNGKSVLLELCRKTLGSSYMRKLPLSFVTIQTRNNANDVNCPMMELKTARMVYYSESDRNEKVNVATVKEITGGEAMSGRKLYGELENFRANCNHVVTTNHQFAIETTEHAVWRRFLSYRFKICFKLGADSKDPFERESDPDLIKKIMDDKRYQEAFLSILIHYRTILHVKYGGQILRVPHSTVANETEVYRQSQDIFQKFIAQRVYYRNGARENLSQTVLNFRLFYKTEHAGKEYVAEQMELIHTFRNTILSKYVIRVGGEDFMEGLYSAGSNDGSSEHGSILFMEWLKLKDEIDLDVEDE